MEPMRVRRPKYPIPEPEPHKPKKKSKKSHNKAIEVIALVHEFTKGSGGMNTVKTHILDINERWHIDIRNYMIDIDRNTQEETERRGKGICISIEFIPELKAAIAEVEKFLDKSVE